MDKMQEFNRKKQLLSEYIVGSQRSDLPRCRLRKSIVYKSL